jgi:DNA repair protein RadC
MKPREKLLRHGPSHLASWELISTILGSGIRGRNVFQISRQAAEVIEKKKEHITQEDLCAIDGIGKVKSMQIIAAFELARRHYITDEVRIESVMDIMSQVQEYRKKKQEYLLTLTLDGAGRLISKRVVTIGLLDQSLAHPREIFSGAIADHANSLVLIHNHPSGNTYPSSADTRTTKRISQVAELVGIRLLDHVIIGAKDYFSFREHSMLL